MTVDGRQRQLRVARPRCKKADRRCREIPLGETWAQMIDVMTGRSERVAVVGRGCNPMQDGFRRITPRRPLGVVELHPDNDSKLLNIRLLEFPGERVRLADPSHSALAQ